MPIVDLDELEAPPDDAGAQDEGEELEPGQLAYECVADVVAEMDQPTLLQLVTHLQAGTEWERLPRPVRAAFEELEEQLFEDDEDDQGAT